MIEPSAYRTHVDEVPGRDPDDKAHIAACAFGGATVLLTRNERDFPHSFLAEHGVTVSSADTYLTGLLRRRPAEFVHAESQLAAGKQRPPTSPCAVAANLGAAGASKLSAALRHRLGCP
jgi:hypothetical protein